MIYLLGENLGYNFAVLNGQTIINHEGNKSYIRHQQNLKLIIHCYKFEQLTTDWEKIFFSMSI